MLKDLSLDQAHTLMTVAAGYPGRVRTGSFDARVSAYAADLASTDKQELYEAIKALTPGARQELTALVWVGRGIYQAEEWQIALRYAGASQSDANLVYLIENGPFQEHVARGLQRLQVADA